MSKKKLMLRMLVLQIGLVLGQVFLCVVLDQTVKTGFGNLILMETGVIATYVLVIMPK